MSPLLHSHPGIELFLHPTELHAKASRVSRGISMPHQSVRSYHKFRGSCWAPYSLISSVSDIIWVLHEADALIWSHLHASGGGKTSFWYHSNINFTRKSKFSPIHCVSNRHLCGSVDAAVRFINSFEFHMMHLLVFTNAYCSLLLWSKGPNLLTLVIYATLPQQLCYTKTV